MTTPTPEELRTMLENAAKACGITLHVGTDGTIQNRPVLMLECGGVMGTMPYWEAWQPHIPGLDSQVLAAELGIDTRWVDVEVTATRGFLIRSCDYSRHPSKAHAQSLAILRVAAAIGESK